MLSNRSYCFISCNLYYGITIHFSMFNRINASCKSSNGKTSIDALKFISFANCKNSTQSFLVICAKLITERFCQMRWVHDKFPQYHYNGTQMTLIKQIITDKSYKISVRISKICVISVQNIY